MAEKSTRVTRSNTSKKNATSPLTTSPASDSEDVDSSKGKEKKKQVKGQKERQQKEEKKQKKEKNEKEEVKAQEEQKYKKEEKENKFTPAPSQKRKHVDSSQEDQTEQSESSKKQKKSPPEEKRLKLFRSKAPQTFLQKLERAQTQRMIVIGRSRHGEGEDLHEDIDIVGTTGNIYTITIGRLPKCTCPDHAKGNECKHKVYALRNVLRAPYELQYQRAFLTAEVEEIMVNAPAIPNATSDSEEDHNGKRKPIEGECPICYMDFDPDNNEIVWCKAACGNNMHKDCFDQWAASQRGKEVRCVYCRQPWQAEKGDLEAIKQSGQASGDGYVNVAEQFGMSRARDYSSYHQPWVRRNYEYR